jgi:hypothetical protein
MFAVAVGFLLKALLKTLARPFAAFGEHLLLDVSQRAGRLILCIHGPPIHRCLFRMGGTPFTPLLWGQCQVAPVWRIRLQSSQPVVACLRHSPSVLSGESYIVLKEFLVGNRV